MQTFIKAVAASLVFVMNLASPVAQAGLLKVSVDKDTKATVSIRDFGKEPGDPIKDRTPVTREDKNSDGVIEFSLDPEGEIATVMVEKVSDGDRIKFTLIYKHLKLGGINIASFEPFELPTFADVAGEFLVTEIVAEEFLSAPPTFTVGETLSVSDGSISRTDTLRFFDEFGDPFDGEARVANFEQFLESVPEPSLFWLTLVAVALMLRSALWRRRLSSADLPVHQK